MEVIHERCCGLDIHKKSIVACLSLPGAKGAATTTVRTFGSMTADILALSDWLVEAGCTQVAMESTGVYWKPIWNLLEGLFTLLLVNPRHMKAVPGRKTDVTDAEWVANLLRHGLLTGSVVPERAQRELRELTRYRTTLVRERTAEANRLQKTLEGANIKLAAVATDILGKSGRDILMALIAGATDAAALAQYAQGRLREKLPALEQALVGQFGDHQRFMVAQQLAHIDFLEATIAAVSAEIAARLQPAGDLVDRLDTIPGIGRYVAEALLAEIGTDMCRFPTAGHLASWAGMCPGSNESAGMQREWQDAQGECVAAGAVGASGTCGGTQEGDVSRSAVPATGGTTGEEPGGDGGGAHDSGDHLPHRARRDGLRRSRPALLRGAGSPRGRSDGWYINWKGWDTR